MATHQKKPTNSEYVTQRHTHRERASERERVRGETVTERGRLRETERQTDRDGRDLKWAAGSDVDPIAESDVLHNQMAQAAHCVARRHLLTQRSALYYAPAVSLVEAEMVGRGERERKEGRKREREREGEREREEERKRGREREGEGESRAALQHVVANRRKFRTEGKREKAQQQKRTRMEDESGTPSTSTSTNSNSTAVVSQSSPPPPHQQYLPLNN